MLDELGVVDGLVGSWSLRTPLCGSATKVSDGMGNHNGLLSGTYDTAILSPVGRATSFTTDGKVTIDTTNWHNQIWNEISVSFWVKLDSFAPSTFRYGIVSSWIWGAGGFSVSNYSTQQNLQWNVADGTSYTTATVTGTLSLDIWYHVVITYNYSTTTVKSWVNGNSYANVTTFSRQLLMEDEIHIGYTKVNVDYLEGSVAKVKMFNKELSESEVLQLYNAGVQEDGRWVAGEFIETGQGNFQNPTVYNGQDGNFWYPNGDDHASYWWTTNYNGTITKYAAGAYLNAPRVDKPTVELYKPGDVTAHATGGRWHGTWSGTYVEPLPLVSGEWYYCSFWYKCAYTTVTTITFKLLSTDWTTGAAYDTITINQDGNWHYVEMKMKNTTDFTGKLVRVYISWSYDTVHAAQTLVVNGIEVYRDYWIEGDTKASLSNKRLLTKKQFIEV